MINYTVEPGFAAPDGSTRLPMTCTLDGWSPPFYLVGPVKNCGPPLAVSAATSISDVAYVMWPNQVAYQCRDGYWLDGEWGNVSDINNTNMFFLSACTLDDLSVLKRPCVAVSCGVAPVVGLATSLSSMSLVSGALSQFGFDVVGDGKPFNRVPEVVSGSVPRVRQSCALRLQSRHTVDGNAASTASLTVVLLRTCTQTSANSHTGHAAAKMFVGKVSSGTDSCTSFALGVSGRGCCRMMPRCPIQKETSQQWYQSLLRSSEFHWLLLRLDTRNQEVCVSVVCVSVVCVCVVCVCVVCVCVVCVYVCLCVCVVCASVCVSVSVCLCVCDNSLAPRTSPPPRPTLELRCPSLVFLVWRFSFGDEFPHPPRTPQNSTHKTTHFHCRLFTSQPGIRLSASVSVHSTRT